MTAVVVVEPDPVVRRGLAAFVGADTDLTVVAEVARHDAELDHHLGSGVDVVLAGVSPEDRAAVALTRQLVRRKASPAVVLIAARVSDALVRDAFRSGARGLLMRDSVADQLVDAIRSVVDGGTWVDSEVAAVLTALAAKGRAGGTDERGLTVQERRVLRLLPRGLTNRQIAEELGVSVDTVKTHLRNALVKLGAHDRIEAARITEREGID